MPRDPEKVRAAKKRYRQSAKGRAAERHRRLSAKRRQSKKRYRQSAKGRATVKRYRHQSEVLLESRRRGKRRYASGNGAAVIRKNVVLCRWRKKFGGRLPDEVKELLLVACEIRESLRG